eukprot:358719-Chlamydomonas_euryale.AAC.1
MALRLRSLPAAFFFIARPCLAPFLFGFSLLDGSGSALGSRFGLALDSDAALVWHWIQTPLWFGIGFRRPARSGGMLRYCRLLLMPGCVCLPAAFAAEAGL